MLAWQPVLAPLARTLLVSYFLKAGINNLWNFQKMIKVAQLRKIPLATLSLALVVIIEIMGSICIIFDYYVQISAILLIIFTLLANVYFCNYWQMEGVDRRNVGFLFYANIAVIGGLLLLISK